MPRDLRRFNPEAKVRADQPIVDKLVSQIHNLRVGMRREGKTADVCKALSYAYGKLFMPTGIPTHRAVADHYDGLNP